MNEERIRGEVIKAIKKNNMAEWTADQILSIKGIRLEADNQDLPENPHTRNLNPKGQGPDRTLIYGQAQQAMLKEGWVKCRDRGMKDPTAGFTDEEIADIRHNACDDTIG